MKMSEQIYNGDLKEVAISGVNVLATTDNKILVAKSLPGEVNVFFNPFKFYPDTDKLTKRLENANRSLHAYMTCDLSNKGRGIISLKYNPLITDAQTSERFVKAIIFFLYECEEEEDELFALDDLSNA